VIGVSAMTLRRHIVRRRRHLGVLMAVLALGAAVALHHDGMAISGMTAHHDLGAAVELCLGVITAVGTAVAAVTLGLLSLRRVPTASMLIRSGVAIRARPPVPRARAGPPLLCVLCISRR
jgi:hypothetical protein